MRWVYLSLERHGFAEVPSRERCRCGTANRSGKRGNSRRETLKFDGNELRERRIEQERSIDELSLACSIPKEMIEAFEEGDLDKLPHRCFATGLLRSYCLQLELSPERFISDLQEALRSARNEASNIRRATAFRFPHINWPGFRLPITKEIEAWLAVCGFLLLGWFAYSTVVRPTAELSQGQAQAARVERPHTTQDSLP